jgi:hypothetical protein
VVLLITLVILVILSTLGYTLSVQVAARRHRDRYIIDYAQAQYACTSGIKHALTSLTDLTPQLISRPNEPDFSDVFALSEPAYQELLAQTTTGLALEDDSLTESQDQTSLRSSSDFDEDVPNGLDDDPDALGWVGDATITGPYGPPWPLVVAPTEFEIGSAKVTVEIEDENAKYPLGWALLQDEKLQAAAGVGFVTFCEWMGYHPDEIDGLRSDFAEVSKIRSFQVEFSTSTTAPTTTPTSLRSRVTRSRSAKRPAARSTARRAVPVAQQIEQQNSIFSQLFHSSLIDTDLLARPSVASESRDESALKYLGLWATRTINVNTAPRHVLEAALAFGSIADAPKIAEVIIRERQLKPFSDFEELKSKVFPYSDAVDKCKEFIVTESTVFTVRVTATSGVAKAVAVAAVTKDGRNVKRIAVISD